MVKERDRVRVRHWMQREEYELAKAKAAECGLPFSRYAIKCMLGRKTVARTDLHFIHALSKLGGLQNKLTGELREKYGYQDETIESVIAEMRDIYREIHIAIRAIKKAANNEADDDR